METGPGKSGGQRGNVGHRGTTVVDHDEISRLRTWPTRLIHSCVSFFLIMTHSNTAEQTCADLCSTSQLTVNTVPDHYRHRNKVGFALTNSRFSYLTFRVSLLTRKKCSVKQLFTTLWFVASGSWTPTTSRKKGVKIWWVTAWVLEQLEWSRRVGDLGPVYGFQLRCLGSIGACDDNYSGGNFDQLQDVIKS